MLGSPGQQARHRDGAIAVLSHRKGDDTGWWVKGGGGISDGVLAGPDWELLPFDPSVPLLILDIDGTVREGYGELGRWVNSPADVRVFPAAVERMRAWAARGGRIIGVSNQGGIALGYVSEADVEAAFIETQAQCDGLFEGIAYCQHHPDADRPELARCWCRKPRPGLAIGLAVVLGQTYPEETYPPHKALFVGDREEDRLCAEALNVDFKWAQEWRDGQ